MDTKGVIITTAASLISSTISSVVTWLLSRRKYNEEVESADIKNDHDKLDFYEDLSDDNKQRLRDLIDENRALREENIRIREENAQIRVDNAAIRAQNDRVMKEVEELKTLINRMIENICINKGCQLRQRGFVPFVIDKSPSYRELSSSEISNEQQK